MGRFRFNDTFTEFGSVFKRTGQIVFDELMNDSLTHNTVFTNYLVQRKVKLYNAGMRNSIKILHNALPVTPEKEEELTLSLNGHPYTVDNYPTFTEEALAGAGITPILFDDNEKPFIYYNKNYHEYYIPITFKERGAEDAHVISEFWNKFKDYFLNVYFAEIIARTSWMNAEARKELEVQLIEMASARVRQELRQEERNHNHYQDNIRDYTKQLKQFYDTLILSRNKIESLKEQRDKGSDMLVKEMDMLAKHPRITDIQLKDKKVTITTDKIITQHDRTDDLYLMGRYKITMNLDNTNVTFINLDNKRTSYWGEGCHHPHVSTAGSACLGNIAPTIAELCAQNQLYALAMVCFDFLESVNTSDPAGKYITKWDKCDEEGNIIQASNGEVEEEHDEDAPYCDCCESQVNNDDDLSLAFDDWDDDNERPTAEAYVCEDCLDENYTFHEHLDAYVNNAITVPEPVEEEY